MKFVKMPVEIEAIQFVGENANDILKFMKSPLPKGVVAGAAKKIVIHTLEGKTTANVGDWIIRGVKGEFYPCNPDIFAATYRPAGRRQKKCPRNS